MGTVNPHVVLQLPPDALAEARESARVVGILVSLMVIDFALGVMRAWRSGKVRSSRMRQGLMTKSATLLVIAAIGLVDSMLPGPIMLMAAVSYCIYEAISVLENAKRIGVKLPPQVVAALDSVEKSLDAVQDDRDVPASKGSQ